MRVAGVTGGIRWARGVSDARATGWGEEWGDQPVRGSTTSELTLPAEPSTVGRARRAVRHALESAGEAQLCDTSELVVSELVTNAVVHAGTPVVLRITTGPSAIRVEVEDGSPHLPIRRRWSDTAGTGRGLRIVDQQVDRWDTVLTEGGKVVWFEIGKPMGLLPSSFSLPGPAAGAEPVKITLLSVPLLMHWAWQEHAASILRDFLLYALERHPGALDDHAAASGALSRLGAALPTPMLPEEPDALMASSVEPIVTVDEFSLSIPASSLHSFEVLDDLLSRAVTAAQDGHLLSPPAQPEMAEMRAWLCGEIARQAAGADPTPWLAATDIRVAIDLDSTREQVYRELSDEAEPLIVTDDTSVIVAVTPSAVAFLGYGREEDLLGRRVLVVVPPRFHQAHIAGTTLHVTNGRSALLDQWISVPVIRADGSEVPVGLHVSSRLLRGNLRVFVARLRIAEATTR